MAGDGLGPDVSDPKQQTEFENAEMGLWAGRYREYVELYQRQAAGDFLTPAEEERFLELRGQIADYEKNNPKNHERLVTLVRNSTRPAADTNNDGRIDDADLNSIISSSFSQSSSFNQNSKTTVSSDQNIKQTSVEYIDLPTPEEFLDDFNNMYGVHITGLVQSGALRPEVAAFAREMQSELFGEYLRKQIDGLLKGEPLWKVVGQDAQNRLVGTRTGAQTDTLSEQQRKSSSVTGRSESSTTTPAPSQTTAGQALESGSISSTGTVNEDENISERTKFDQTEAIVARNKLSYVANLAPLDFLKDSATAQRLNFLYGAQKGTAQREAQTASGRESAAVRRI